MSSASENKLSLDGKYAIPLILLAILVVFLFRSTSTQAPRWWDTLHKWRYAAQVVETGDFTFDRHSHRTHHYIRWGVNIPLAISMLPFGAEIWTYYFTPVLYFSIFLVLFMVLARTRMPKPYVWLLGSLIIIDPIILDMSNRPETRVYGILYILLTFYCLSKPKEPYRLFLGAFALFWAWGAKETYLVYFGPGILLYLWRTAGFGYMSAFCAYLLGFLCIEIAAYNSLFSNVVFGKLQILMDGEHLRTMAIDHYPGGITWGELFTEPWVYMSVYYSILERLMYIYAAILLISKKHRESVDSLTMCILAGTVSYVLMNRFLLYSIDPLLPFQPLKATYVMPAFPFMIYLSIKFIHTIIAKYAEEDVQKFLGKAIIFVSVLLFLIGSFVTPLFGYDDIRRQRKDHFMTERYFALWNQQSKIDIIRNKIMQGYAFVSPNRGALDHNEPPKGAKYILERQAGLKETGLTRHSIRNNYFVVGRSDIPFEEYKGCFPLFHTFNDPYWGFDRTYDCTHFDFEKVCFTDPEKQVFNFRPCNEIYTFVNQYGK